MHYDKNECLVLDEIDENWQKVSKSVTSKNGNTRRRTFFRCKKCDLLFPCTYANDINKIQLLHFCSKARQLSLMDRAKPMIEYSHYNFVADAHLSMSQATSNAFYSFFNSAFTSGYNALIQANPQINRNLHIPKPEDFYKPIQRCQFTSNFNNYAELIEKKCLQTFSRQKYCSLALDAGKVNSIPMLALCLSNPFNNNGALLYKIVFYFGGNANDYQNEVLDILRELKTKNIIISSFIGDNLPAQTRALKWNIDGAIQKISDDPYVQTIEWMSCCCHTTALGFDDMTTSIETLSDFQNKLSKTVKFFRTKTVSSKINVICPSFRPTRWTNFSDIMIFFINKAEIITVFLVNNQHLVQKYLKQIYPTEINFETFIFKDIPSLYWMLIPYKYFINLIEADSFPASYLYPMFENFCSLLMQTAEKASEIGDNFAVTYADSLISSIKLRFENIYSQRFLKMLWFLTPAGRIQAREEYGDQSDLYSPDANLICCDLPQLNIDTKKIQKDILDFVTKSKERIEEIKKAKNRPIANDEDLDYTEVEKDHVEYEKADIGIANQEVYTSTLEEIENLVYEKALKLIPTLDLNQKSLILEVCKDINEYPNLILDEFHNWILNGITSPAIIRIYKFNPWCFWQECLHMNPNKQIFGHFCLRYLAITASSACCERSFHDINQEMTPERMRTSETLLRHRINVRKHQNINKI